MKLMSKVTQAKFRRFIDVLLLSASQGSVVEVDFGEEEKVYVVSRKLFLKTIKDPEDMLNRMI